jgi:thiol:disulfide interchange protein DsbD
MHASFALLWRFPRFRRFLRIGVSSLFLALVFAHVGAQAQEKFLPVDKAFALTVQRADAAGAPVQLSWKIAEGYYLYRDRLSVTALPSDTPVDFERPAGEKKEDPNFGTMEVYHHALVIPAIQPRTSADSITVTWQGCAEAGLCYPPQSQTIALAPAAADPPHADTPPGAQAAAVSAFTAGNDSDILGLLQHKSLAWTLPLFFALGIALAFTPCVLPMVPIMSSIVVGAQASPRRAAALTLAFILAMAATYAALGVAAAMAGANLQALLQTPWTLFTFSAIFVVLAFSMFGFFTLQLPAALRERLDSASRARRGGSLPGVAGMGVLSALLVGPCMTAPLAGTLLYIAQTGNAVQGGLLLFSLGLGMGVPLFVAGAVGSRYLPKPGPWMDRVKGTFGFLLLGTAIWMVERVVSAPFALALWGALVIVMAVTFYQLAAPEAGVRPHVRSRGRLLLCSAALVSGLWGGAMILGAARGAADPWQPLSVVDRAETVRTGSPLGGEPASRFSAINSSEELRQRVEEARAMGKPVLVDFYADWCVSCKSIEKEVFGDPQVQRLLAGVVLLRADVTANTPAQRALMHEHQIIGPPTVMLFDAGGQERRAARLVGEFSVPDLVARKPAPGGPT